MECHREQSKEHHVEAKEAAEPCQKKERSTLTYVLLGLTVFLLLFTAVQTMQINTLEQNLVLGLSVAGAGGAGGVSAANIPAPRSSAPPAMVGGC